MALLKNLFLGSRPAFSRLGCGCQIYHQYDINDHRNLEPVYESASHRNQREFHKDILSQEARVCGVVQRGSLPECFGHFRSSDCSLCGPALLDNKRSFGIAN